MAEYGMKILIRFEFLGSRAAEVTKRGNDAYFPKKIPG